MHTSETSVLPPMREGGGVECCQLPLFTEEEYKKLTSIEGRIHFVIQKALTNIPCLMEGKSRKLPFLESRLLFLIQSDPQKTHQQIESEYGTLQSLESRIMFLMKRQLWDMPRISVEECHSLRSLESCIKLWVELDCETVRKTLEKQKQVEPGNSSSIQGQDSRTAVMGEYWDDPFRDLQLWLMARELMQTNEHVAAFAKMMRNSKVVVNPDTVVPILGGGDIPSHRVTEAFLSMLHASEQPSEK